MILLRDLTLFRFLSRLFLPLSILRLGLLRLSILCLCLLYLWLTFPQPTWAAVAVAERVPLTPELLQSRLKSPTQTEGIRTIDLRRLVIDLRPENAEFRDQFYRLIQAQIQRSSLPLGLDLSYSLVQGEFKISTLGIRTPLYGQSALPLFNEAEQAQLSRDRFASLN